MKLKNAIVLAAGLGTRMRPLTEKIPKPLVQVGGKPLIEYCFDQLRQTGVQKAVVNIHHLADQIEHYVQDIDNIEIEISDERACLLNSGGGIKQALSKISAENVILLNADTFWIDDKQSESKTLSKMAEIYDQNKMDILLMLVPISQTVGHEGGGDFKIDPAGRLERFKSDTKNALVYGGAAIINRGIVEKVDDSIFSLNKCFDEAISKGRLFGYVMSGHWFTVGTMDAIGVAEAAMEGLEVNS